MGSLNAKSSCSTNSIQGELVMVNLNNRDVQNIVMSSLEANNERSKKGPFEADYLPSINNLKTYLIS